MSQLSRVVLALLLLGSSTSASAFVRSTTVEEGPDQGFWLWWDTRQVTYAINRSTFGTVPGCSDPAGAAVDSFPTWTAQGTDFTYRNGGDTTNLTLGNDAVNLVVVRKRLCSEFASDSNCASAATIGRCIEDHNCWSHADAQALALTTVTFVTSTGQIVDADMELHGWDGTASTNGFFFTCASPPAGTCNASQQYTSGATCIAYDVANTVTHEAGHMLGLDHVCVESYPAPFNACNAALQAATMFPSAAVGDVNKRSLAADDISGVSAIYPTGQPTVKSTSSSSSNDSGGCSVAGGGGLLLAALAPLLRRRHRKSRSEASPR